MKLFSTMAIAAALSALCVTAKLSAMDAVSQRLTVPFSFKVDTAILPAGDYRVEREFGKQTVFIVNLKTGLRVQMIGHIPQGETEKVKLRFETTADGYKLAKIS